MRPAHKRVADKRYRERHRAAILVRKRGEYQRYRKKAIAAVTRWRLAHPEKVREYQQRCLERHRDRYVIGWLKDRRARRSGEVFTVEEWQALKTKYDHRCLRCGKQEPVIRLSPDHIVPIFLNGGNSIANIQPLCRSCNMVKYTKIRDYRRDILSD